MPLSCSCYLHDDIYTIWSETDNDYSNAPPTGRRRRCSSCGVLINHGEVQLVSHYWRVPRDDIEEKIHGDDGQIKLADRAMCECCADLYFSFQELGFECVSTTENMLELCAEYADHVQKRTQHEGEEL